MALAVDSFVEHAVIVRMNKQFLEVTAGKLMFSRNNCMQNMFGVFCLADCVEGAMMCPALLLMNKKKYVPMFVQRGTTSLAH